MTTKEKISETIMVGIKFEILNNLTPYTLEESCDNIAEALIKKGLVFKDEVRIDKDAFCKFLGKFNKEPSHVYELLSEAIANKVGELIK